MVIRNVVVGRLRDEADGAELEAALAGIAALDPPGCLGTAIGRDAGLRAGGWSFAITNDWADADAYRAYDVEPVHNGYRARIAAVCSDLARVEFEV